MAVTLRPYQTDIIDQTRELMRTGNRSILITSPTGSGKTALTAHMLETAASRGKRCWFIVHRRELVKQSVSAFGGHCGVVAAGFTAQPSNPIQICSIGTLVNRLNTMKQPDMVVWDECHHSVSASWNRIRKALPQSYHVGLTATPERLDGRGLGEHYGAMVLGPTTAQLIEDGYLANYKYYAPQRVSDIVARTVRGDYDPKQLASQLDRPAVTGDVVDHYRQFCDGKRAVGFGINIVHSMNVVDRFNASGIRSEHVDGKTPTKQRDKAIERFQQGETLILMNVDLFGEGFDLPSIEACLLLRPTQSLSLFLQQVGRSLRPSPGKTHAVILDHAGNVELHGLPDDDRQWSLDSAKRSAKSAGSSVGVRICEKCYAVLRAGAPRCEQCGGDFIPTPDKIKEADGMLKEIERQKKDKNKLQNRIERSSARSLAELTALAERKGYKNPSGWAWHVYNGRRRKTANA